MLELLVASPENPLSVLCLGAHCDDVEIGCGGTLLRLANELSELSVTIAVFTGDSERRAETKNCTSSLLTPHPVRILTHDFRDGHLPASFVDLKAGIEALKLEVNPDLVFTHHRQDRHQDHRIIAELTWNTFRNHLILEYEIPKFEGDLGQPNAFVPLSRHTAESKARLVYDSFVTQQDRSWFTQDTFLSLMRIRGLECNAPEGYAEAFHAPKQVLRLSSSF